MENEISRIELIELAGNDPIALNSMQKKLEPITNEIATFWIMMWFLVAVVLLSLLSKQYTAHRKAVD